MVSLRPNIVWIMADDMGYGEPGSYPCTSENGRINTPNLDQYFAGEGMSFRNAYAGYTGRTEDQTYTYPHTHEALI